MGVFGVGWCKLGIELRADCVQDYVQITCSRIWVFRVNAPRPGHFSRKWIGYTFLYPVLYRGVLVGQVGQESLKPMRLLG